MRRVTCYSEESRGVSAFSFFAAVRLFVVRLVMSPLVPASVIDVFRAAAAKAARARLLMVGGARRTDEDEDKWVRHESVLAEMGSEGGRRRRL